MNKRVWLSMLVVGLIVICLAGTVIAAIDEKQLEREVLVLEYLTKLDLTNDQLDSMISTFKEIQNIYAQTDSEYRDLLIKQKELLLAGKAEEAGNIRAEKRVLIEKANLQAMTILIDLQLILTPEQKEMIGNFTEGSGLMRIGMGMRLQSGKKDEVYLHNKPGVRKIVAGKINTEQGGQLLAEAREKIEQLVQKRQELLEELQTAEEAEQTEILQNLEELDAQIKDYNTGLGQKFREKGQQAVAIIGNISQRHFIFPAGFRLSDRQTDLTFIITILEEMREAR